jgi:hypothetical protein
MRLGGDGCSYKLSLRIHAKCNLHAKFNSQQYSTKGTRDYERANWSTRLGSRSASGFGGLLSTTAFDGPSPVAVPNCDRGFY